MRKEYLKIETHRDGYSVDQCYKTITARQLIDYLEENCDNDTPIYFSNDNGYTYGHISLNDIDFDEFDDEDDEE